MIFSDVSFRITASYPPTEAIATTIGAGHTENTQRRRRIVLFVTYTIMQSISSSEMCSLHLTHPSAHTPGAVGTHTHTHTHTHTPGAVGTHTHTHTHTHTPGAVLRCPGSSRGFGALLKGLSSVVDDSCRSRDSNPQPRVTSPTLYLLGHNCLTRQGLLWLKTKPKSTKIKYLTEKY